MDPKRILIIDDEVDFTYLLKRYLESKKCSVDVAHNLEQGMQKLDSTDPYYIFLDNNLPDGSGWEKAGDILRNHPNSELCLMSGNMPSSYKYKNLTVLEKPFTVAEIDKIVFHNRA